MRCSKLIIEAISKNAAQLSSADATRAAAPAVLEFNRTRRGIIVVILALGHADFLLKRPLRLAA